jgi:ABC-type Fe2+-enterobactin transport system substrate-binding protein
MLAAATYQVPVSSCKSSSTGQEDPQKTYQSILRNLEEYRGEKRSAKQIRNVQKMTAEVRDAPKKKARVIVNQTSGRSSLLAKKCC